ncbi:MAG: TolC family protein [Calditrichaeota bacterium]|nr:TolC family protein [Calditrichota bacterium]
MRHKWVQIAIAVLLILCSAGLCQNQNKNITIGIILDDPSETNNTIAESFIHEITALIGDEFNVQFPEDKVLFCDQTIEGIDQAFKKLLADKDVDLILALGMLASNYICCEKGFNKPVIAPFVVDAELQGLDMPDGVSGIKNLNYLSVPASVSRNIDAFRDIVLFDRLAVLESGLADMALPQLKNHFKDAGKSKEIEITYIPIFKSADEAKAIPDDVQAVYVGVMTHLTELEFDNLVQYLIERKLPSFSVLGSIDVKRGIMAGLARSDMLFRFSRRTALNVQRILLGEKAHELPVVFSVGQRLILNLNTVRQIGISPPWEIMTEAELVKSKREDISRKLTLTSVLQEAIKVNLDLRSQESTVSAGREDVRNAYSNLKPQLNVSGTGVQIDKDRAQFSSGQVAEQTLYAGADLSQLLFSEPAFANISIQKHLQNSREHVLEQTRLDVVSSAALAYLNLLRAKALENIQKNNLRLTRSNLELAQIRKAIGAAGPSEVWRWESAIASARKSVISSNSMRNLAEMELNRVLHRPLEESFAVAEDDIDNPESLVGGVKLFSYLRNPLDFRLTRDFLAGEGLEISPELLNIDAAIAAQERVMKSAWSSFWVPTAGLKWDISDILWEGGEGTEDSGQQMYKADNTTWSVGINLSLPIYSGGSKKAEFAKARKELRSLTIYRDALSERIEQRIRSTLHIAGSSHAGIKLARKSAEAANQNLRIVTDSYASGIISILDLLDAQNAAVIADQLAANSVYDFLIDYMNVQRAIGSFDILAPEKESLRLERLGRYLDEKRVEN